MDSRLCSVLPLCNSSRDGSIKDEVPFFRMTLSCFCYSRQSKMTVLFFYCGRSRICFRSLGDRPIEPKCLDQMKSLDDKAPSGAMRERLDALQRWLAMMQQLLQAVITFLLAHNSDHPQNSLAVKEEIRWTMQQSSSSLFPSWHYIEVLPIY